jgi:hypothetical protein
MLYFASHHVMFKKESEMELKENDQAYCPASATSVQRTWKRVCNWTPPSKDPLVQAKWDYYKSLSILSANALQGDAK